VSVAPRESKQRFEHFRVVFVVREKLRGRSGDERPHAGITQEVPGTLIDEHHFISVSVSGRGSRLLSS
jgi:hypothetical protein